MPPRFLDTNILMRYFTRDDEHKAAAALALLRCIQAGTEQVSISPLVVFEVVFLLERTYQLPQGRVADAVLSVLTLPGEAGKHDTVAPRLPGTLRLCH